MSRQVAGAAAQASHEPYSRAVVSGGLVFCSGTLGIDPATGKAPESAADQAEQALLNLAGILSEHARPSARAIRRAVLRLAGGAAVLH